jgi:2-keto-3-deoxy-galactonokinase
MKTMSDFNKWLFSKNGKSVAYRRSLKGLTNLSPAEFSAVSSSSTWFHWSEEKSSDEPAPDEKLLVA